MAAMPRLAVALIRDRGIDFIVVPLDGFFGQQTMTEKESFLAECRARAAAAGLSGSIVLVWDPGDGSMQHFGSRSFQPLINDWTFRRVKENLTSEI